MWSALPSLNPPLRVPDLRFVRAHYARCGRYERCLDAEMTLVTLVLMVRQVTCWAGQALSGWRTSMARRGWATLSSPRGRAARHGLEPVRWSDHPPCYLGGSRGDGCGGIGPGSVLLGQPVQDSLGDHQLLPLGLDLLKPPGQLLGERIQFTPASRDPLQLPHPQPSRAFPAYRPGYGS
jgi:hypothetical protein